MPIVGPERRNFKVHTSGSGGWLTLDDQAPRHELVDRASEGVRRRLQRLHPRHELPLAERERPAVAEQPPAPTHASRDHVVACGRIELDQAQRCPNGHDNGLGRVELSGGAGDDDLGRSGGRRRGGEEQKTQRDSDAFQTNSPFSG